MKELKTDILVIGAGSGGLSVAAGAAQMGADVILLEGHKMGGDCLNFGCVPSKALIASGKMAYGQAHSAPFGVADVVPQVDYAAAKDHVAATIAAIDPIFGPEVEASLSLIHDYQVHFSSIWMLWAGVVLLRRPSLLE